MVEHVKIDCPFCKESTIEAIHIPSTLQTAVTRVSAKTSTQFYRTKKKYEIESSCSNCGKSVKEIQKALDEGKKDLGNEKRILKRLKEQGLNFTKMETKF